MRATKHKLRSAPVTPQDLGEACQANLKEGGTRSGHEQHVKVQLLEIKLVGPETEDGSATTDTGRGHCWP